MNGEPVGKEANERYFINANIFESICLFQLTQHLLDFNK